MLRFKKFACLKCKVRVNIQSPINKIATTSTKQNVLFIPPIPQPSPHLTLSSNSYTNSIFNTDPSPKWCRSIRWADIISHSQIQHTQHSRPSCHTSDKDDRLDGLKLLVYGRSPQKQYASHTFTDGSSYYQTTTARSRRLCFVILSKMIR